jgi:hypothetical protein
VPSASVRRARRAAPAGGGRSGSAEAKAMSAAWSALERTL